MPSLRGRELHAVHGIRVGRWILLGDIGAARSVVREDKRVDMPIVHEVVGLNVANALNIREF